MSLDGQVALYLFLSAGAVAWFTSASVNHWVTARSEERRARERFALLKALAEQPRENAERVLSLLRELEAKDAAANDREERLGYFVYGVIALAGGLGMCLMLAVMGTDRGAWTVGLIPTLVGAGVLAVLSLTKPVPASPAGKTITE